MEDMNRGKQSKVSLLQAGLERRFDTRMGLHIFDSFVPILLHEFVLHRNKVKAQGQFSQTVLQVRKFHHIATLSTVPEHLQFQPFISNNLAGLGGDLGGRALSTLLALDALGTTLSSGGLGLLGLLGGGGSSLLLLGLLDGLLAGGLTGLGALGAALLDHVEGSTNDGTLVLDNTAGALLGDLL